MIGKDTQTISATMFFFSGHGVEMLELQLKKNIATTEVLENIKS